MAIKSLNAAYEHKLLDYLCNACGDINDPNIDGPDFFEHEAEDIMTSAELELYKQYWSECGNCWRYVLRLYENSTREIHRPAIGLAFLFDRSWCCDILKSHAVVFVGKTIEGYWMPKLFSAVTEAAKTVIEPLVPGCDLYLGDNTDPDGHELLVVIPYELRAQVDDIDRLLDGKVYSSVEKLFLESKT